jgi:hypothetical protein
MATPMAQLLIRELLIKDFFMVRIAKTVSALI